MELSEKDIQRFWSKVDKTTPTERGCWERKSYRSKEGYTFLKIYINGKPKTIKAHRIAYYLANGQIDETLLVLHSCDNPPCCNPDHLRQGTFQDNASDRSARNRSGINKISPEQAYQILFDYAYEDIRPSDIAKRYGIDVNTVHSVIHRGIWNHIIVEDEILERVKYKNLIPMSIKQGRGRNSRAKLNEQDVLEIRHKRATEKTSYKILAAQYGVTDSTIWFVLKNRTWKEAA